MSSERIFPASELKLQRLREQGIVPLSRNVQTAAVVTGIAGGVYWVFSTFGEISSLWKNFQGIESSKDLFKTFGTEVSSLLVKILFPALVIVVLIGLIQTRFLFRPGLAAPDFRRLKALAGGYGIKRRASKVLISILICFGGALGLVLLMRRIGHLGGLDTLYYATERTELFDVVTREFSLLLGAGFTGLMAIGIMSWIVVRVQFLVDHRMTRVELEAEARESEISPELKAALRQRGGE